MPRPTGLGRFSAIEAPRNRGAGAGGPCADRGCGVSVRRKPGRGRCGCTASESLLRAPENRFGGGGRRERIRARKVRQRIRFLPGGARVCGRARIHRAVSANTRKAAPGAGFRAIVQLRGVSRLLSGAKRRSASPPMARRSRFRSRRAAPSRSWYAEARCTALSRPADHDPHRPALACPRWSCTD